MIVDGWVFKLLSKLLVQGYTLSDLDVIFARVPDARRGRAADRRPRRPSTIGGRPSSDLPNSACTPATPT